MTAARRSRRTADLLLIIISVGLVAVGLIGTGSAVRTAGGGPAPSSTWTSEPAGASAAPSGTPAAPSSPPDATRAGTVPPGTVPAGRPRERAGSRPGRPVAITIEQLGIRMPIRPRGVGADGQMKLPDSPRTLGWYRYGPRPGADTGSAVLAGHVDSNRYGVGPLARLRSVRPGNGLMVSTTAGAQDFTVVAVDLISKKRFPADRIFDRDGPRRLWVITCGGAYDPQSGGYQDNLVVEAVPV